MRKKPILIVIIIGIISLTLTYKSYNNKIVGEKSPSIIGDKFAIYIEEDNGEFTPTNRDMFPTLGEGYILDHSDCVDRHRNAVNSPVIDIDPYNIAHVYTTNALYCNLYFKKYSWEGTEVKFKFENSGQTVHERNQKYRLEWTIEGATEYCITDGSSCDWKTIPYEMGKKFLEDNIEIPGDSGQKTYYVKLKTSFTEQESNRDGLYLQLDITPPTCSLKVENNKVVFARIHDDRSAEANIVRGISRTNTTIYGNINSINVSGIGEYYGYVKDEAGNEGRCTIDVQNDYGVACSVTQTNSYPIYCNVTQENPHPVPCNVVGNHPIPKYCEVKSTNSHPVYCNVTQTNSESVNCKVNKTLMTPIKCSVTDTKSETKNCTVTQKLADKNTYCYVTNTYDRTQYCTQTDYKNIGGIYAGVRCSCGYYPYQDKKQISFEAIPPCSPYNYQSPFNPFNYYHQDYEINCSTVCNLARDPYRSRFNYANGYMDYNYEFFIIQASYPPAVVSFCYSVPQGVVYTCSNGNICNYAGCCSNQVCGNVSYDYVCSNGITYSNDSSSCTNSICSSKEQYECSDGNVYETRNECTSKSCGTKDSYVCSDGSTYDTKSTCENKQCGTNYSYLCSDGETYSTSSDCTNKQCDTKNTYSCSNGKQYNTSNECTNKQCDTSYTYSCSDGKEYNTSSECTSKTCYYEDSFICSNERVYDSIVPCTNQQCDTRYTYSCSNGEEYDLPGTCTNTQCSTGYTYTCSDGSTYDNQNSCISKECGRTCPTGYTKDGSYCYKEV